MDTPKALAALAALRAMREHAVATRDVLATLVKTCRAWEQLVSPTGLVKRDARGVVVDVNGYHQHALIELLDAAIEAETERPWNVFKSLDVMYTVLVEVEGEAWAAGQPAHISTMDLYARCAALGRPWVPVRERGPAIEANTKVVALWDAMKKLTEALRPRLQELYAAEDAAMAAAGHTCCSNARQFACDRARHAYCKGKTTADEYDAGSRNVRQPCALCVNGHGAACVCHGCPLYTPLALSGRAA